MNQQDFVKLALQVTSMLAFAVLFGEIMRRLKQPAVVGEMLGGIVLGPTVFGLIAPGLYLVMALEAGGSLRRSRLVAGMCAVMAALYVAALLLPPARTFFALTVPGPEMIVTALAASAVSIGALALSGYSLRVAPADSG